MPKEGCCNWLKRVLFTNIPPPCHYDYCLQKRNKRDWDEATLYLRQGYGYSLRGRSDSIKLLKSKQNQSLKSSCKSVLNLLDQSETYSIKKVVPLQETF